FQQDRLEVGGPFAGDAFHDGKDAIDILFVRHPHLHHGPHKPDAGVAEDAQLARWHHHQFAVELADLYQPHADVFHHAKVGPDPHAVAHMDGVVEEQKHAADDVLDER